MTQGEQMPTESVACAVPYGGLMSFGARFVEKAEAARAEGRPLTQKQQWALEWAHDLGAAQDAYEVADDETRMDMDRAWRARPNAALFSPRWGGRFTLHASPAAPIQRAAKCGAARSTRAPRRRSTSRASTGKSSDDDGPGASSEPPRPHKRAGVAA